jgi:hypothetical protein
MENVFPTQSPDMAGAKVAAGPDTLSLILTVVGSLTVLSCFMVCLRVPCPDVVLVQAR